MPNLQGNPLGRYENSMTAKHMGVGELARLVAELAGGSANATDRERAVVLALELYRIDEISRMIRFHRTRVRKSARHS